MQAVEAMKTLRHFIGRRQLAVVVDCCRGEEKQHFFDKLVELAGVVNTMPKTYEQSDKGGEAVAYLHYFMGGCDWWITEKDAGSPDDPPDTGQAQAFGLVSLGYEPELGYISLPEVFAAGAELDFHWRPKTLAAIKAKLAGAPAVVEADPEMALRGLWDSQGVPKEKQAEILAEVTAKAQPGASVGPFVIQ
jgi:hypothetical protein